MDNSIGNSGLFEVWELELIAGKAKGLIGSYGFTEDDLPDIEQELCLKTYLKRQTYETWQQKTASPRTVLSRILDNCIRDMIDAAMTDKRRVYLAADSLETETGKDDDAEPLTLADMLGEDGEILSHRSSIKITSQESGFALAAKLQNLTEQQQSIIKLLLSGFSKTEAAQSLGMPRTTLNREMGRIRKYFDRDELAQ